MQKDSSAGPALQLPFYLSFNMRFANLSNSLNSVAHDYIGIALFFICLSLQLIYGKKICALSRFDTVIAVLREWLTPFPVFFTGKKTSIVPSVPHLFQLRHLAQKK